MKNIPTIIILLLFIFQLQAQETITETYEYDEVGRLIKANYDNASSLTYVYDPSGNILNFEAMVEPSGIEDLSFNRGVKLFQNFPNPSHDLTLISYYLPFGTEMELSLFNNLGQQVLIIDRGLKKEGLHEISLKNVSLAPGLYNYQLRVQDIIISKKMLRL